MELGDTTELFEPAVNGAGELCHFAPCTEPSDDNVLRSTPADLLFEFIHRFMMIFNDL